MKNRRRLFSVKNPYDTQTDDIFFNAVKENFQFQYEHCEAYKKLPTNKKLLPTNYTVLMILQNFLVSPRFYSNIIN